MDRISIRLKDFKCFRDDDFELNDITFLTGANAAGKSSLIQSLLIVNSAIEAAGTGAGYVDVPLNDPMRALELGNVDSVINRYGMDQSHIIIDGKDLFFDGGDDVARGMVRIHFSDIVSSDFPAFPKLSYLSAERIGPRYETDVDKDALTDCGCNGEKTASVIFNNQFTKVSAARTVDGVSNLNFRVALNDWIQYLFPGITISVNASGATKCQIYVNNDYLHVNNTSTNVGFGISYVLPVLVTCLLAERNRLVIIDNPEVHLHAKAQSNMGFFLGKMAASGLRILVETHSEHIINGVRRAIVEKVGLSSEMVTVYFLDYEDGRIRKRGITIDSEGNMSSFPVDFFDQQRQDSKAIFEAINNK